MALILIHQASLQIPDSHGSSPHTIIPTPSKGADQFLCSALFERKLRIATAYNSTNLFHLIATNSHHLIIPFVSIRGVDLIGPTMYFGLMGDGQPIGSYDDMWAGWCIKVISSYSDSLLRLMIEWTI
ncbi:predicted protein [Arabidopsis lyrata subsp. lyrata]|uniref:Predicted protein n=1 Tax=Arabidopsis lyrata subsp. lyrata TaxID=81972 RepID=D7M365_ARALL|nr:predicted protein [Arabidopsis lyrata subsp. lyrata]